MRKVIVGGWLTNVSHQPTTKNNRRKVRVRKHTSQSKVERLKANENRANELIDKAIELRYRGQILRAQKLEEMANQLQTY